MAIPYHDRDSLSQIEEMVLEILDPPLNLEGRPITGLRILLTDLHIRITTPG